MIRWNEPGYVVGFTTRVGGVSQGPYASLNLGRGTGDDVDLVDENRRRACAVLGIDPHRLAANRQVHSAVVNRAEPGRFGEPGDGVWTDEPQVPMLATVADCVPIAIAARGRGRLALLHAGWRGLSSGLLAEGAAAVRDGNDGADLSAIVGPSAGPCCYEVGDDVAHRFDRDLTREGKLDLWSAAERLLRAAGVAVVQRVDMCTICNPNLFFSHRRDGKPRGVQGVIGYVA
jgi:purine-nucleoside/S-methyl-5'-thioadenosine phosphorylase / adenosine deaminase